MLNYIHMNETPTKKMEKECCAQSAEKNPTINVPKMVYLC